MVLAGIVAVATFLISCAPPAPRNPDASITGVVLMHGNLGHPWAVIGELAGTLEGAGYLVDQPEMCWSNRRKFDRPYLECIDEIDASVARLTSRGARNIVIAGMSMGGSAAIAYGTRREGFKGVIALAPAPPLEILNAGRGDVHRSVLHAQEMVAVGQGDAEDDFMHVNLGPSYPLRSRADVYLSFYAPDSPGNFRRSIENLKAPLLWVAGDDDRTQMGPRYAFTKAPANPLNRYVTVKSNHFGTPSAAQIEVLRWLDDLTALRHQGIAEGGVASQP